MEQPNSRYQPYARPPPRQLYPRLKERQREEEEESLRHIPKAIAGMLKKSLNWLGITSEHDLDSTEAATDITSRNEDSLSSTSISATTELKPPLKVTDPPTLSFLGAEKLYPDLSEYKDVLMGASSSDERRMDKTTTKRFQVNESDMSDAMAPERIAHRRKIRKQLMDSVSLAKQGLEVTSIPITSPFVQFKDHVIDLSDETTTAFDIPMQSDSNSREARQGRHPKRNSEEWREYEEPDNGDILSKTERKLLARLQMLTGSHDKPRKGSLSKPAIKPNGRTQEPTQFSKQSQDPLASIMPYNKDYRKQRNSRATRRESHGQAMDDDDSGLDADESGHARVLRKTGSSRPRASTSYRQHRQRDNSGEYVQGSSELRRRTSRGEIQDDQRTSRHGLKIKSQVVPRRHIRSVPGRFSALDSDDEEDAIREIEVEMERKSAAESSGMEDAQKGYLQAAKQRLASGRVKPLYPMLYYGQNKMYNPRLEQVMKWTSTAARPVVLDTWRCPACDQRTPIMSNECRYCHADRPAPLVMNTTPVAELLAAQRASAPRVTFSLPPPVQDTPVIDAPTLSIAPSPAMPSPAALVQPAPAPVPATLSFTPPVVAAAAPTPTTKADSAVISAPPTFSFGSSTKPDSTSAPPAAPLFGTTPTASSTTAAKPPLFSFGGSSSSSNPPAAGTSVATTSVPASTVLSANPFASQLSTAAPLFAIGSTSAPSTTATASKPLFSFGGSSTTPAAPTPPTEKSTPLFTSSAAPSIPLFKAPTAITPSAGVGALDTSTPATLPTTPSGTGGFSVPPKTGSTFTFSVPSTTTASTSNAPTAVATPAPAFGIAAPIASTATSAISGLPAFSFGSSTSRIAFGQASTPDVASSAAKAPAASSVGSIFTFGGSSTAAPSSSISSGPPISTPGFTFNTPSGTAPSFSFGNGNGSGGGVPSLSSGPNGPTPTPAFGSGGSTGFNPTAKGGFSGFGGSISSSTTATSATSTTAANPTPMTSGLTFGGGVGPSFSTPTRPSHGVGFGSSSFGAPPSTPSFGAPTATPSFGGPTATPGFGAGSQIQPSTPFGATQAGGGSLFGSSTGGFGSQGNQRPGGIAFGAPTPSAGFEGFGSSQGGAISLGGPTTVTPGFGGGGGAAAAVGSTFQFGQGQGQGQGQGTGQIQGPGTGMFGFSGHSSAPGGSQYPQQQLHQQQQQQGGPMFNIGAAPPEIANRKFAKVRTRKKN